VKNELKKSGRIGARKDFPDPPRFRARFVPISLAPAYLCSISSGSFPEKAADNRVYHIAIAWNRITRIMVLNTILLQELLSSIIPLTPDMDVDVAVELKLLLKEQLNLTSEF